MESAPHPYKLSIRGDFKPTIPQALFMSLYISHASSFISVVIPGCRDQARGPGCHVHYCYADASADYTQIYEPKVRFRDAMSVKNTTHSRNLINNWS